MFSKSLFAAVAALSAVASAQNYSVSSNGTLEIDASQISLGTRMSWCLGQTNNCPLICGGQANPNTCNPNDLGWSCVCTDGSKPNVTAYAQTMPFFICQAWIGNCVASNQGNATAQFACQAVQCGSKNASALATDSSGSGSSSSSSASASASSTGSATTSSASGTSSGTAASATKSGAATALNVAKSYGTGIVATGLLAFFGLAL